ncbi:MAG TPA: arginyltransferase [Gammaproteobacteria bacterium]|nr:arginyltransferase [Gammaproteobacteria bacterium]
MNDELKLHRLLKTLPFYLTPPHPCSYLDERQASTVFVDPSFPLNMEHYNQLAKLGFRRSGDHVYRPECANCKLCIPVRIPVNAFRPNRSQKRCWRRNEDLRIRVVDADFREEHFKLYRRYMSSRHAGGGMDKDDPEAYQSLIAARWCDSALIEFRLQQKLLAVAVVDQFEQGMSAVYTFFDPDLSNRSLGVYAVLAEIHMLQEAGQDWLYLGYWNPQSPKMAYKNNYTPLEFFDQEGWTSIEKIDLI